jgi:hypothetical protein
MTHTLSCIMAAVLLTACPHNTPDPNTPQKDPYAIARAVIQGAQLTLLGADGVFEITVAFMDPAKVPDIRKDYLRIRAAVVAGLKIASDGVDVAESQKAGFDIVKLLAQAETAYQDILKFLGDLKAPAGPTSRAVYGVAKYGTSKWGEKYKDPELEKLPKTLLPAAK